MSRTEASWRLRKRYRKEELSRFSAGGRVLCDDTDLLYEEHPDVYKPVDRIVGALEDADAAYRVAALAPLVTVKL
jgi:release factor H-coupled RctB family protein